MAYPLFTRRNERALLRNMDSAVVDGSQALPASRVHVVGDVPTVRRNEIGIAFDDDTTLQHDHWKSPVEREIRRVAFPVPERGGRTLPERGHYYESSRSVVILPPSSSTPLRLLTMHVKASTRPTIRSVQFNQ